MNSSKINNKFKFYNFKIHKPFLTISIIFSTLSLLMFCLFFFISPRYIGDWWLTVSLTGLAGVVFFSIVLSILSVICPLNLERRNKSHLLFIVFYYIVWCAYIGFSITLICFYDINITYIVGDGTYQTSHILWNGLIFTISFFLSVLISIIMLIMFIFINNKYATYKFTSGLILKLKNKKQQMIHKKNTQFYKVSLIEKSGLASFLLCLFFGSLGFHRIFSKKVISASIMFILFIISLIFFSCISITNSAQILTMQILGSIPLAVDCVWVLIDLITILYGRWTIKK